MAFFKIFLLFFFVYCALCQGSDPIVKVCEGVLRGVWKVSTNGRTYATFQGVPYARPPVGKYRFREPQPMKPWAGTWDATRVLSPCLQYNPTSKQLDGDENCLFLNVHTPKLTAGTNLPVMIFIHGGAFMYGSGGGFGPENLMDKDMVVVTINYRLGPLGFLSTGDEFAPGNAGLKDQAAALRWVQENIMMFGGNPASVTLTGCSAGGASVHYHALSPMSKGTFVRGIAFSGSAFCPWTHAMKPLRQARALSAIVGCPTISNKEMVDCLKHRPGEVVVNAQVEMFEWKVHLFSPFIPTLEASTVRTPFLTQYPYHAALNADVEKVQMMASVTSEEGLYPAAAYQADPSFLPELEARWEELASNIFEYNDTLPLSLRPEVAKKIKQHYLGGQPVSQNTFGRLVEALGDRLFVADVGRFAQLHAARSGQPVHVYRYAHRGSKSLSNLLAHNDVDYGVSHADDVLQIFNGKNGNLISNEDKKIQKVLIDMIYSYASTGVPKLSNNAPEWLPVQPGSPDLNYMEISSPTTFEMKASSDFGQRSFWDSLGFVENDRYQVHIRDEI